MPPRRRLRSTPVTLALLFVVLAVGCAGGVRSVPGPGRGSAPEPHLSSAVLGDVRTVDPCTLTDPATLQRFGQVRNAGTVSLDYCLLHVRMSGRTLLQLAVGELRKVDPAEVTRGVPVTRRGALRIVHSAPLPGHCTRQILFSDGIAMQVSADLLAGDPTSGLCRVAEAGARTAVDTIAAERVGHRWFPPDSLALIDPCTVVDTAVVQRVPGLKGARPRSSPGRHQCQWGPNKAGHPRVRMVHTAGDPPRVSRGAAVAERIAGRRTVVGIVGGNPRTPLCMAETAHIPFEAAGTGQVEVAMLVVAIPGSDGIRACEFARGLAERIWPRLPPA
ncbi:hypothetical protein DFQ14_103176 [Halopolyspora algeriensis]|uniref:DUF3558 domain-containing protein n=1 Tax=Halopolyspora algeriensis TaxID=1500506 RepID=A0A368VT96_9ACTN|nr:hypothetical protein [Halopolyspora algeriensis]RCW45210.1 hypothetical protein DFQ14_103176 [Halopolyspora algeriensis]TQM53071.1 hypothetical protein FHU43_2447 [Halopolyspora algeriensis]